MNNMPIKIYYCENCSTELRQLLKQNEDKVIICDRCNTTMKTKIPNTSDNVVKECADPYRNKQVKMGLQEIMKKRAKEHFVKNELPDLVEQYGQGMAKTMGWFDKDGKVKKTDDYK